MGFKTNKASNHRRMLPIPNDEKTIEEAKQAQSVLEIAMRPATSAEIALMFKKLTLHCGKQVKSFEEINSMVSDYYHDLKEYPVKLIEEACEQYRKLPSGNNFMPMSGQLIALMTEKYYKMQFLKARIEKLLGENINPALEPNKKISLRDALESFQVNQ